LRPQASLSSVSLLHTHRLGQPSEARTLLRQGLAPLTLATSLTSVSTFMGGAGRLKSYRALVPSAPNERPHWFVATAARLNGLGVLDQERCVAVRELLDRGFFFPDPRRTVRISRWPARSELQPGSGLLQSGAHSWGYSLMGRDSKENVERCVAAKLVPSLTTEGLVSRVYDPQTTKSPATSFTAPHAFRGVQYDGVYAL